jgi:NTP pyrophosphatase (non-canonical NTP hydrolase)
MDSFSHLTHLALQFRADRDWAQFHTPKELAISLVVEATELLELMQWKQGQDLTNTLEKRKNDVADELADVLHSLLLLAHDLQVDLPSAFTHKLAKAAQKYPIEKSKGKPRKYNELDD